MAQIVISDLEGTLINTQPARLRLLQQGEYEKFGQNWTVDQPNRPVLRMLQLLFQRGCQVHIFTGRDESLRGVTEEWLWKYNVPFAEMKMRAPGDMRQDWEIKREWVRKAPYNPSQVFSIFEDRSKTVALYRQMGFFTLQVNERPLVDNQTRAFESKLATLP